MTELDIVTKVVHFTEEKKLETIDIQFSRLSLGTWAFSGDANWGPQDDESSIRAVDAALDAAIYTFDTAEAYGDDGYAETVLGKALHGRRNNAVIATKAGPSRVTEAQIIGACEDSLRRLRTDYVDLYQIHWPSEERRFEEQIAGMERLKNDGKIRSYGVCNFGPRDLDDFQTCAAEMGVSAVPVTDQVAYNLLWRGIEDEIIPKCRDNGIGILAYSPIAQGLLAGKYTKADDVPAGRARTKHFSGTRAHARHGMAGHEQLTFRTLEHIRAISENAGIAMADLALGWLLAQDGVTSVLVGARNADQVARNANALHQKIPADVLLELESATRPLKTALGGELDLWSDRMR